MEDVDLSLWQRIVLKLGGRVYVEHRMKPGFRRPIAFYAFNCEKHGLVTNYPHGRSERLPCPICHKELLEERAMKDDLQLS